MHRGEFEVGEKEYVAQLGHQYFDIYVLYDTKALYGKLRGHREVTVSRE